MSTPRKIFWGKTRSAIFHIRVMCMVMKIDFLQPQLLYNMYALRRAINQKNPKRMRNYALGYPHLSRIVACSSIGLAQQALWQVHFHRSQVLTQAFGLRVEAGSGGNALTQ